MHTETGVSPWLTSALDVVPYVRFIGVIVSLLRRQYFFTLTSNAVVLNACSRFRSRPGDIVAHWERSAFPVSGVKRGKVWSVMRVELPGESKPTRINVSRYWRAEWDQLLAALPPEKVADVA